MTLNQLSCLEKKEAVKNGQPSVSKDVREGANTGVFPAAASGIFYPVKLGAKKRTAARAHSNPNACRPAGEIICGVQIGSQTM
jgi:hypothetical protein